MTVSASTPRLRMTRALYLVAALAAALTDERALVGGAGVAASLGGSALVVLAVLGRIWTSLFIAGRKDVQLVTTGPYAACRHPLYACSLAAAAGLGLAAHSIALTLALPALLAVAFAFSIGAEERLLAAAHGERWSRYAAEVPRLWPAWRRLEWPARIDVEVAVYRKAFVDAASFLGLLLVMQALAALRDLGWWPALFALP